MKSRLVRIMKLIVILGLFTPLYPLCNPVPRLRELAAAAVAEQSALRMCVDPKLQQHVFESWLDDNNDCSFSSSGCVFHLKKGLLEDLKEMVALLTFPLVVRYENKGEAGAKESIKEAWEGIWLATQCLQFFDPIVSVSDKDSSDREWRLSEVACYKIGAKKIPILSSIAADVKEKRTKILFEYANAEKKEEIVLLIRAGIVGGRWIETYLEKLKERSSGGGSFLSSNRSRQDWFSDFRQVAQYVHEHEKGVDLIQQSGLTKDVDIAQRDKEFYKKDCSPGERLAYFCTGLHQMAFKAISLVKEIPANEDFLSKFSPFKSKEELGKWIDNAKDLKAILELFGICLSGEKNICLRFCLPRWSIFAHLSHEDQVAVVNRLIKLGTNSDPTLSIPALYDEGLRLLPSWIQTKFLEEICKNNPHLLKYMSRETRLDLLKKNNEFNNYFNELKKKKDEERKKLIARIAKTAIVGGIFFTPLLAKIFG